MAEPNNTEDVLLSLVSELKDSNPPLDQTVITQSKKTPTTIEDINDLTKPNKAKTYERNLTSTDFLILNSLSEGKSIEQVSLENDVTENYLKKLMRSDAGSNFLKEQSTQKSELALSMSTATVSNGVTAYNKLINDLLEEGKTSLGLQYLFGKMSLMEVQAMLHKQQQGTVDLEDADGLKNLFVSIAVNGGK